MTIDLRTASVDEMRDWLAKAIGWRFTMDELGPSGWTDPQGNFCGIVHPIPTTLDAIAAVWRTELVGWYWERIGIGWYAVKEEPAFDIDVHDTGDELADRLRLTCLALAAERGIK